MNNLTLPVLSKPHFENIMSEYYEDELNKLKMEQANLMNEKDFLNQHKAYLEEVKSLRDSVAKLREELGYK